MIFAMGRKTQEGAVQSTGKYELLQKSRQFTEVGAKQGLVVLKSGGCTVKRFLFVTGCYRFQRSFSRNGEGTNVEQHFPGKLSTRPFQSHPVRH